MRSRDEHLAWCKSRAIAALDRGELQEAVGSMISDIGKWREPLYDRTTLAFILMDGLMFCKTPDQVRHWIEGFN